MVGAKYITEKQHPVDRHLDIVGMILSTVTVFCIIWGMLNKENDINAHWYSLNIMGVVSCWRNHVNFIIIWELHQQHPMMDLTLFARPTFVGACLAGFTISMGLFSFFTYLTILLQDYMGYSPLNVGLQRLIISLFPLLLGTISWTINRSNRYALRHQWSVIINGHWYGFDVMDVRLSYSVDSINPGVYFYGIRECGH